VAGVEGAKPGVLMLANPTSSSPPWAIAQPPGEDGDAAGFQRTQKRECVPFGCFDNVLVVEEGKKSALNNEVNFALLSPAGLAEASKEALRIETLRTPPQIRRPTSVELRGVNKAYRTERDTTSVLPDLGLDLVGAGRATRPPRRARTRRGGAVVDGSDPPDQSPQADGTPARGMKSRCFLVRGLPRRLGAS